MRRAGVLDRLPPPAVLAKAVTAVDLLSGGRAAIGLGARWAEVEYAAYGIDFLGVATRMD